MLNIPTLTYLWAILRVSESSSLYRNLESCMLQCCTRGISWCSWKWIVFLPCTWRKSILLPHNHILIHVCTFGANLPSNSKCFLLTIEGEFEECLSLLNTWASLVAQLVKNAPATRETWVQSLDWEDSLEKRTATHTSILAWRIPYPWGRKESDTTEWLSKIIVLVYCRRDNRIP